jgi:hypothetical protein
VIEADAASEVALKHIQIVLKIRPATSSRQPMASSSWSFNFDASSPVAGSRTPWKTDYRNSRRNPVISSNFTVFMKPLKQFAVQSSCVGS